MKLYVKALLFLSLFIIVFVPTVSAASITYTFNSLAQQDIGYVPHFTQLFNNVPITFEITNMTGVTWTDFHLSGVFDATSYSGPGTGTFPNPFTYGIYSAGYTLDITGLNVLDGDKLTFDTSAVCIGEACGLVFYVYTAYPTTTGAATAPVPEPASLLLLGSGVIAAVKKIKSKG